MVVCAYCAPLDIVFSEYNVLQPDLIYYAPERSALLTPDQWGPVRIPPDLAIEILSPSTEARDRGRKQAIYASYHVPEYWIVDVKGRRVELLALDGDTYNVRQVAGETDIAVSPTLPGLRIPVSRLFDTSP